jgi:hypothetical protein
MTLRALILLTASTAAIACAGGARAATNLLTNGGFDLIGAGAVPESWGGLTYYTDGTHPGNVALPGWTVEAGSVDLTSTASGWGPADMGPYSLDINGWSAGTISQQFATVLGQTYFVSYAFSRNEAGSPNDPVQATVAAGGVSQLVSVSYEDPAFGSIGHMLWEHGGFSFVGDGNEATIRLAAVTDSNAGVFFDTVAVTTAGVPEPAAWALMIGGFGMAGAMLRRRRAAFTAA